MTDPTVLDDIRRTLALTDEDVARILGEEVDVVKKWNGGGVPAEYEGQLAPLVFVSQFMKEWYIEPSIPDLVRRPLPELKDRSVLQALAADPEPVVGYLQGLFSFPSI